MNRRKLLDDAAHHVTKEFTDRGKLIEAGFALFAHYVIAKDAPAVQLQAPSICFQAS